MSADLIPLLDTLRTTGLAFLQTLPGRSSTARLYEALADQAGAPVTQQERLVDLIPMDRQFSTADQRRFIRLQDANESGRTITPLIYLDGDFRGSHPVFRVQLVLVAYNTSLDDDPQCLLLRFETPEGNDPKGIGKHDFYHSQLCTGFRPSGPDAGRIAGGLSWLTLSCPAWPLDAKTPVHLLACLVFSLYGKREGFRLLQLAYGETALEKIQDMHFAFPSDERSAPAVTTVGRKKSLKTKAKKRAKR